MLDKSFLLLYPKHSNISIDFLIFLISACSCPTHPQRAFWQEAVVLFTPFGAKLPIFGTLPKNRQAMFPKNLFGVIRFGVAKCHQNGCVCTILTFFVVFWRSVPQNPQIPKNFSRECLNRGFFDFFQRTTL